MAVAPGSYINVEIRSLPRRAAALKTICRVCAKDAAVRRATRKRQEKRPSWQEWQRGGMMWHHQMKSPSLVRLEPGASYRIRATVDVLRDLESVKDFVAITPAK